MHRNWVEELVDLPKAKQTRLTRLRGAPGRQACLSFTSPGRDTQKAKAQRPGPATSCVGLLPRGEMEGPRQSAGSADKGGRKV